MIVFLKCRFHHINFAVNLGFENQRLCYLFSFIDKLDEILTVYAIFFYFPYYLNYSFSLDTSFRK